MLVYDLKYMTVDSAVVKKMHKGRNAVNIF